MFMLNELLIKELSSHVETNTSDIQKIKAAEIYSTSEIKTNKIWIDGKPVYRKVINIGSQYISTSSSYDISDLKVDTLVDIEAGMYASIGVQNYKNRKTFYASSSDFFLLFERDDSLQIRIAQEIISTVNRIQVLLEYTKTTD